MRLSRIWSSLVWTRLVRVDYLLLAKKCFAYSHPPNPLFWCTFLCPKKAHHYPVLFPPTSRGQLYKLSQWNCGWFLFLYIFPLLVIWARYFLSLYYVLYHINLHNKHIIKVGTIIIFSLQVSIISPWRKKEYTPSTTDLNWWRARRWNFKSRVEFWSWCETMYSNYLRQGSQTDYRTF